MLVTFKHTNNIWQQCQNTIVRTERNEMHDRTPRVIGRPTA